MKDINEILNTLPSSWDEFTLKQFNKLLDIRISDSNDFIDGLFDGADNTVKILAALTGVEADYFESLPLKDFSKFGNRLAFMQTKPTLNKKSVIKWKDINTLTYNDYIVFNQHSEKPLENLALLIQAFSKDKLSIEEIEQLSMSEVHTAFFILRKQLRRFTRRTMRYTALKLIGQQMKNLLKITIGKLKFRSKKQPSKNNTAITS